jgi:hypothetical protein
MWIGKSNFIRSILKYLFIFIYFIIFLFIQLDGFFIIDFQQNQELIDEAERFILNDIRAFDEEKSKVLLDLLHNPHIEFDLFVNNNKVSKKLKKVFN